MDQLTWGLCYKISSAAAATDPYFMCPSMNAAEFYQERLNGIAALFADDALRSKIETFGESNIVTQEKFQELERFIFQAPVSHPTLEREIRAANRIVLRYMEDYIWLAERRAARNTNTLFSGYPFTTCSR